MGTKMAPPYANIFMGRLKKQLPSVSELEAIFVAQVHR